SASRSACRARHRHGHCDEIARETERPARFGKPGAAPVRIRIGLRTSGRLLRIARRPANAVRAYHADLRERQMKLRESAADAIGATPLVALNNITAGLGGRILAKLDYLNPG